MHGQPAGMKSFNCPNCGNQVEQALDIIKMTTCTSCGTSLFLADDRALTAGQGGEMHDTPLLFGIGDQVVLGSFRIDIYGHARYSYGRGFWDEFWGVDGRGDPYWVSVDEGDIVLQEACPKKGGPRISGQPRLGEKVMFERRTYRVNEIETAECVAVRGSFDEQIDVGDTHTFLNATNQSGELLSGEFWDGGEKWFQGDWYDPFEIKVVRGT